MKEITELNNLLSKYVDQGFFPGVQWQINFNDNIAVLSLDETPKLQYNLIKNISTRFDISIIDEDIRLTPNTVSGKVKIRFNDE